MRVFALITFIIAHLSLLFLVFDNYIDFLLIPLIILFWLMYFTNVYYFSDKKYSKKVFIIFIISGITWLFPPLLATYFGIPFFLIFLGVGIYLHSSELLKNNR